MLHTSIIIISIIIMIYDKLKLATVMNRLS